MSYFNNVYTLKLDIKQQNPNPVIRIVQYDSAVFKIELYDNGRKIDIKDGERFTVSVEHEATGETHSGIAKYDGEQFVVYDLRKADMKNIGTYRARFASYKDRNRVSSLMFRYEVYEDYETVGDASELTMLQELFQEVEEVGRVTQRQGEYAEDRGDYANAAGDYANRAGDSQIMNWLPYVKTLAERNKLYPNPENGDTVYVIDENKVFRYDGIDALDWEAISGYDTSVIQDIYNTKEDKTVVAKLREDLNSLTIGARNLLTGTDFEKPMNLKYTSPTFTFTQNKSDSSMTLAPTDKYVSTSAVYFDLEKEALENNFFTLSFNVKVLSGSATIKFKVGDAAYSEPVTVKASSNYQRVVLTASTQDLKTNKTNLLLQTTSAITIEKESFKAEIGNRATTWTPSYQDIKNKFLEVQKQLDNHNNKITGIETELNTNVVKKKVYDIDKAKDEEKFSQIMQSANELSSVVSKKVGTSQVKSIINQTSERIRIKASNIDFDGAVIFKNKNNKIDPNAFIRLNGGELTAKGYYSRVWRDGKARNRVQVVQLTDGMLRISDPQGDLVDSTKDRDYRYDIDVNGKKVYSTVRSLYYTSDGISTYRDGSGKAFNKEGKIVSSGTIEFFSHEYSRGRGLTLYSAGGAIGLQAANNAIHIDAAATLYNRSRQANVIIRPHENVRKGINDFKFGISADNTGRLVYGDESKRLGVGLRFSKSSKNKVITGIDSTGRASSDVRLEIGEVRANKILSRDGKETVYFNNAGSGNLTQSATLRAGGIKTNATNFYVGVRGELRVTNTRGANFGKGIGYMPVRASKFNSVSSRKYKTNIKDLEINSLDVLNSTDIKQYNLKSDLNDGIDKVKYGVILEDSHDALKEGDAIDVYTMTSILWDVVKKQQKEIEQLKK
ncbi:tail fiber domain-containing protein [Staphylococcus haemolyticus]|uniref:tail fiber domain-containing protein n=1 Tax=Staphylococcus haemolyticus TaxID=1283 RepID=UPI0018794226|nr:tail fiber domain-containing protein [Staphylococcus haemolyticus]MBE7352745.1 tail fiber domain-containing protein [Staphylococcus haemolyticus]